jgi:hypothetical protein
VCAPGLRLGRSDLTHRFSQPANNEWHSGMSWCVPFCQQPLFYSFIGTLLSIFPIHSCFIAGFIPLLFLFVLVYIPSLPFCYAGFCANFHTSVPILMYFIRLGFILQPISSFSFFFSCLCCEGMVIMLSLYLSPKVDYHPNYRPVICTVDG